MQAKRKRPLEKQIFTRLTSVQHSELTRKAFDRNMSVSTFVRKFLESQEMISPTEENIS